VVVLGVVVVMVPVVVAAGHDGAKIERLLV
jgi:hypothetical protein